MKRWKKSMKTVPGLTLCGKRINQHCDTDKDTRISQTEWTICLGVAKGKTYWNIAQKQINDLKFQKKKKGSPQLHYDL